MFDAGGIRIGYMLRSASMLVSARTHYLVCTDPMLRRPLTDSGCTYASYFTSAVTLEVKAERSSDLRVERSSKMGAERSSNSKSRVGWSSDLGVGWNLEQRKCEMGCPLTRTSPTTPVNRET